MNQHWGYQYANLEFSKPVILSLPHGYVLHFIYKLLAVLQEYITSCKSTVLQRQAISKENEKMVANQHR